MEYIAPLEFQRLAPQIPRRVPAPTLPDHDSGDEHGEPTGFFVYTMSPVRMGGVAVVWSSMWCEAFDPPRPDHDPGDEDDYHNYIPSRDPRTGLRCWWPR